jgi:hypothetical protein
MSDSIRSIELPGLDGSNPLAFLAALGLLYLVSRASRDPSLPEPTLDWTVIGAVPQPRIRVPDVSNRTDLVALALREMKSDFSNGARPSFLYGDIIATNPAHFRGLLEQAMSPATTASRPTLDLFAGFGSDACLQADGKQAGLIKPSAISFANRQSYRYLLDDYAALVIGLTTNSSSYPALESQKLFQALFEPWTYSDQHKELRWDPSELRIAALPSCSEATVHGANALAFWALAVLSCAPTEQGLRTLGVRTTRDTSGRNEIQHLLMPMWDRPASLNVVRALLGSRMLSAPTVNWAELRAVGVLQMFACRIISYQKAYYFAPSISL